MGKSKIKQCLISLIVLIVILAALPLSAAAQEPFLQISGLPEGFETVAQNSKYAMVLNDQTCEFGVVALSSGNIWWSNPQDAETREQVVGKYAMEMQSQITLRYLNVNHNITETANSTAHAVRKGNYSVEHHANGLGVTLTYTFSNTSAKINPKGTYSFWDFIKMLFGKKSDKELTSETEYIESHIKIPLSITLNENGIKAEIKDEDIEEINDMKLLDVGVLPYFDAGSPKDDGYIFLPDGCGAVIEFNNGKTSDIPYKGQVYGKNYAITYLEKSLKEIPVYLPVFGVKKAKTGMLTMLEGSAASASIVAQTNGMNTPYACAYAEYRVRSSDTYNNSAAALNQTFEMFNLEKRETQNICQQYYLLDDESVTLSDMADITANAIGNQNQKGNAEVLLNVTGAVYPKDNIMGIPVNLKKTLTTFDECTDIINTIAPENAENVVVHYQNWTSEGIKQQVQDSLKPEKTLGGRDGLDKLLGGKAQIYLGMSFNTYKRAGIFSDLSKSARTIYRSTATVPEYFLSVYTVNDSKLKNVLLSASEIKSTSDDVLEQLEKISGAGISLDQLSTYVYGDYRNNNIITACELVELYKTVFQKYGQKSPIMSDYANFYAMKETNIIMQTPTVSTGNRLFSYDVPFYQMVTSRFAQYGGSFLNKSDSPETEFLRCLSFGALPSFDFISRDVPELKDTDYSYFSGSLFSKSAERSKDMVNSSRELYGQIKDRVITDYTYLSSRVMCTTFRSGEQLIVNMANEEYTNNDLSVPVSVPAKSYILLKGGAAE